MHLSRGYGKELKWETTVLCSAEFLLTQVLPVKGRLAQEVCEARHVPKAEVDSLTCQRMHAMGRIPAQTNKPTFLSKYRQLTEYYCSATVEGTKGLHDWYLNLRNSVNVQTITFFMTYLPNESYPMSDIL